jgi:hypothetical protein
MGSAVSVDQKKMVFLEEALGKVKGLTNNEVSAQIMGFFKGDLTIEERVYKYAKGLCYDRDVCKELGVDYATLRDKGFDKIYLVAWYVITNELA